MSYPPHYGQSDQFSENYSSSNEPQQRQQVSQLSPQNLTFPLQSAAAQWEQQHSPQELRHHLQGFHQVHSSSGSPAMSIHTHLTGNSAHNTPLHTPIGPSIPAPLSLSEISHDVDMSAFLEMQGISQYTGDLSVQQEPLLGSTIEAHATEPRVIQTRSRSQLPPAPVHSPQEVDEAQQQQLDYFQPQQRQEVRQQYQQQTHAQQGPFPQQQSRFSPLHHVQLAPPMPRREPEIIYERAQMITQEELDRGWGYEPFVPAAPASSSPTSMPPPNRPISAIQRPAGSVSPLGIDFSTNAITGAKPPSSGVTRTSRSSRGTPGTSRRSAAPTGMVGGRTRRSSITTSTPKVTASGSSIVHGSQRRTSGSHPFLPAATARTASDIQPVTEARTVVSPSVTSVATRQNTVEPEAETHVGLTTRSGLVRTASITSTGGKGKGKSSGAQVSPRKTKAQTVRFSEEPESPSPVANTSQAPQTWTLIQTAEQRSAPDVDLQLHHPMQPNAPTIVAIPDMGDNAPGFHPTTGPQQQPESSIRIIREGHPHQTAPQITPSTQPVDQLQVFSRPSTTTELQQPQTVRIPIIPIPTDALYSEQTHIYHLWMDMPGVKVEDVEVRLVNCWWNGLRYLCIRGERWPWAVGGGGRQARELMGGILAEVERANLTENDLKKRSRDDIGEVEEVRDPKRVKLPADDNGRLPAIHEEEEEESPIVSTSSQEKNITSKPPSSEVPPLSGKEARQPAPVGGGKGKFARKSTSKRGGKGKGKEKEHEPEPESEEAAARQIATVPTIESTAIPISAPVVSTSSATMLEPQILNSNPSLIPPAALTTKVRDPNQLFRLQSRGRKYGRMEKMVPVPIGTTPSNIEMDFVDGVLAVRIDCGPPLEAMDEVLIPVPTPRRLHSGNGSGLGITIPPRSGGSSSARVQ